MSIKREFGHTIKDVDFIVNKIINKDFPIPFLLCLDVDHGDISSSDSRDYDYVEYIKQFGSITPIYHIKQSLTDKGGHYPFIEPYNSQGKIVPEKLLELIEIYGLKNAGLYLELSFREREPSDSLMEANLKQSIDYWKKYLD